jgi:hypothetical protein
MYLADNEYICYCTYINTEAISTISEYNTPVKRNMAPQHEYDLHISDEALLQLPHISQDDDTLTTQHNDEDPNNWIILQSFEHIHTIMTDIINEWINCSDNESHPFTIGWTKAKYFGLRRDSTWEQVSTKLSLTTIMDYIHCINRCPVIQHQYQVDYHTDDNTIRYHSTQLSVLDHINMDP